MTQPTAVFTVCHATGADPAKARELLEDLAASYEGVDAAARLLELDGGEIGRCNYVIVWGWGDESLSRLKTCLSDLDERWPELVYIVGDPAPLHSLGGTSRASRTDGTTACRRNEDLRHVNDARLRQYSTA